MDNVRPPVTFFLCGFMGSGKSSLGKTLAHGLQFDFFDLDEFIEQKTNRSIADIFQKDGEHFFRETEQKYLHELLMYKQNKVIALGGGTVCFFDNLKVVKNHGFLLYLRLPAATLCQRLSKTKQERPLLSGLSEAEKQRLVENMLADRKPFYEQAHRIVDVLQTKPETLLNEIRKML